MNKNKTIGMIIFLLIGAVSIPVRAEQTVSVITDPDPEPGTRHGINRVISILNQKGYAADQVTSLEEARGDILIVAGLASASGEAARLIETYRITLPSEAESLDIRTIRSGTKNILLVSGSDDRGLMYALRDVADRIAWSSDQENPLNEVKAVTEKPHVADRTLSMYTMHRSTFEGFFYDRGFWEKFLDMLAGNRFNSFALIFGYENSGYFAPPYPFFFDLEEFPGVRVVGMTPEKQKKNLNALNRIVAMTHERGLDFTLGIWDHIYRGGVQGPTEFAREPSPGVVWGLDADNLTDYTKPALKKFLELVPDLDAIQFRMHGESGLKQEEFISFWENIYRIMNEYGGEIRFDARAKNFPDILIDRALEMGVNIRLCTKYWMEQMGLPYHPTHVPRENQFDRRHGYADLLRYPQRYKIHWRMFNSGTTRILLWGDPEYARRFAASTHLYGGEGFEVNHPLSTKMQTHPHEEPPFELINPKYRYYDWEFERFWHFYQVFGRLGYNPDTPPEVWGKEFERRYGRGVAPYVEEALHRASRILPRIVAYHWPYDLFPTTRGWPEKYRLHDLPRFARAEGSDTEQFLSPGDAAKIILEGGESGKISPRESSAWFTQTAESVLAQVEEAERRIGADRNNEFMSTMVDMKILAHLALYHSRRILAALNWCLFEQSRDLNALDRAIAEERLATAYWEKIVAAAGDVYHFNMKMGQARSGLTGHWKDELEALKRGLQELEQRRASFQPELREVVGQYIFGSGPLKEGYQRIERTRYPLIKLPNGHYELSFSIGNESGDRDIGPIWIIANGTDFTDQFVVPAGTRMGKRLNTEVVDHKLNLSFQTQPAASWDVSELTAVRIGPKIAHVPLRRTLPGKSLDIRATVSGSEDIKTVDMVVGNAEAGYSTVKMTPEGAFIYAASIPVPEEADRLDYFIRAVDEKGRRASFPGSGAAQPISILVSTDLDPPLLSHAPHSTARPGVPLKIAANVKDPSGVKWVRVRYRSVNQSHEFKTLTMLPTGKSGEYQALIPGEHVMTRWDFMFFFEVMDTQGNGKIYPDLDRVTPYIVVKLIR